MPEMLAWYALLAAAAVGVLLTFRTKWRDLMLPLGFTAGWIVALAVTEGNTGNIFRHRSQFIPFVFLVSSVGLAWGWDRWRQRRAGQVQDVAVGQAHPAKG